MKKHASVLIALVVCGICSLASVAAWVIVFWREPIATSTEKWDHFGGYLGGTVSPLLTLAAFALAFYSFSHQQNESRQTKYFDLAVGSLKRAYDALVKDGAVTHDRLAWLNGARQILGSEAAARNIKDNDSLHALFLAERSHYQMQLYELLRPYSLNSITMQPGYWQCDSTEHKAEIDERSARVIFEFISWPQGEPDLIDTVSKYSDDELKKLPAYMRGLQWDLQDRRTGRKQRRSLFKNKQQPT